MAIEAKPPRALGPEGRALWRSVARAVAEDELELDAKELTFLRTACKLTDRAAQLERAMDEQDLVVKGYNGQPVINSIWGEWRLVCQLAMTTLSRIKLDIGDVDAGLIRINRANPQRAGANKRWGREA
jgi:hypothetical protein